MWLSARKLAELNGCPIRRSFKLPASLCRISLALFLFHTFIVVGQVVPPSIGAIVSSPNRSMGSSLRRNSVRPFSTFLTILLALNFAIAVPEPVPQGDVYQFSGAIYVVNGAGQVYSQASPAICPNNAPQSCGAINVWNWCCAAGCSCYQLSNGVVGCCPQGQSCGGSVAAASVSTVTVYATTAAQQNTVVVAGAPPTTTTTVNAAGTTTTNQQTETVAPPGGYCSTLTARGADLPTTRAGQCGTILVVNDATALWEDVWHVLRLWTSCWISVSLILLSR